MRRDRSRKSKTFHWGTNPALVTRLLPGILYGIRPLDPVSFVAMSVLLLLVSVGASSLPASRAARVDPIQTLREQ
jgi:ABC-type antimicrobial peptide transport system permease subunit